MAFFRTILMFIAIISFILSIVLSFRVDYNSESLTGKDDYFNKNYPVSVSVAVDSAADGGATGMAILSGLCFVAFAITYVAERPSQK